MPWRKGAGWLFFRIGDCVERRVAGCCGVEMETHTDRPLDAAAVFKALGHPARLKVARELVGGERCVFDLVTLTGLGWSTVSRHLSVMREAGVLAFERRGQQIVYRLVLPCVAGFIDTLDRGGVPGGDFGGVVPEGDEGGLSLPGEAGGGGGGPEDVDEGAARVAEMAEEMGTEAETEVGREEVAQVAAENAPDESVGQLEAVADGGDAPGDEDEPRVVVHEAGRVEVEQAAPAEVKPEEGAAVASEESIPGQQELQLDFDWANG